jgi:hypothetical protein
MKQMKKSVCVLALAAVAMTMVGCRTTMDDRWRADFMAELSDAHFRPLYEAQNKIVMGEAEEKYSWWGFVGSKPEVYANEIGGPLTLKPGCCEAAFADACKKANCQILLAPRFTVTKEVGFLWFSGRTKATVEGIPAFLKGAEEIPLEKWVDMKGKLHGFRLPVSGVPTLPLP